MTTIHIHTIHPLTDHPNSLNNQHPILNNQRPILNNQRPIL
ncbi:MAG TPA: hypothetical protein VK563_06060 [Puia sp.]|nr:hypothetical protein [Puia sp.]